MPGEVGQQPDPESEGGAARLVPGLVLIEAQVGIERGLPDVEPLAPARRIVEQDGVDAVACARRAERRCPARPGRPRRRVPPLGGSGDGTIA